MKFVKRISLFFIYPLTMFSIGFFTNTVIMEYFYPGDVSREEIQHQQSVEEQMMLTKEETITEESITPNKVTIPKEVVVTKVDDQIVTANTKYIIQNYQEQTNEITTENQLMPTDYIGLNRDKIVKIIDEYNNNPPLVEREAGFVYSELVSFSPEKIVVKKSYENKEQHEDKGFFLLLENNYVVVYEEDLEYIYMHTGIQAEDLPEYLQQEIIYMKYIENEKELFNFLESFSS